MELFWYLLCYTLFLPCSLSQTEAAPDVITRWPGGVYKDVFTFFRDNRQHEIPNEAYGDSLLNPDNLELCEQRCRRDRQCRFIAYDVIAGHYYTLVKFCRFYDTFFDNFRVSGQKSQSLYTSHKTLLFRTAEVNDMCFAFEKRLQKTRKLTLRFNRVNITTATTCRCYVTPLCQSTASDTACVFGAHVNTEIQYLAHGIVGQNLGFITEEVLLVSGLKSSKQITAGARKGIYETFVEKATKITYIIHQNASHNRNEYFEGAIVLSNLNRSVDYDVKCVPQQPKPDTETDKTQKATGSPTVIMGVIFAAFLLVIFGLITVIVVRKCRGICRKQDDQTTRNIPCDVTAHPARHVNNDHDNYDDVCVSFNKVHQDAGLAEYAVAFQPDSQDTNTSFAAVEANRNVIRQSYGKSKDTTSDAMIPEYAVVNKPPRRNTSTSDVKASNDITDGNGVNQQRTPNNNVTENDVYESGPALTAPNDVYSLEQPVVAPVHAPVGPVIVKTDSQEIVMQENLIYQS